MSDQTLENSALKLCWNHCQVAFQNLTSAPSAPLQLGWDRTKEAANTFIGSLNNTILPRICRSQPVRTGFRQLAKSIVLNYITTESVVDSFQQTWQSVLDTENNVTMLSAAATAAVVAVSGLAIHRYRKRGRPSTAMEQDGPTQAALEDTLDADATLSPKRQRRLDGESTIESAKERRLDYELASEEEEKDNRQHEIGQTAVADGNVELKQCPEQLKMEDSSEEGESTERADSDEPETTSVQPSFARTSEAEVIQVSPDNTAQGDATKSTGLESTYSHQLVPVSDDESKTEGESAGKIETPTATQLLQAGKNETEKETNETQSRELKVQDETNLGNASSPSFVGSKITTPAAARTCGLSIPITVTKNKTLLSSSPQGVAEAFLVKVLHDAKASASSSSRLNDAGVQTCQTTTIPIHNVIVTDTKGLRVTTPTSAGTSKEISIRKCELVPCYDNQTENLEVILFCNDEYIRSIQFELRLNFFNFNPQLHLKDGAKISLMHWTTSSIKLFHGDKVVLLQELRA